MTEKRFVDYFDKDHNYIIQDLQNEDEYQVGFVHCDEDVFLELVNNLAEENEQLKQSVNNLKDTIIKITIAYQRKYDRTIVDLVDEIHDEDITDLIKELKE